MARDVAVNAPGTGDADMLSVESFFLCERPLLKANRSILNEKRTDIFQLESSGAPIRRTAVRWTPRSNRLRWETPK